MSTPERPTTPSEEELPGEELEDDDAPGTNDEDSALTTTDSRLSFSDADALGRERGLHVVMFAGEIEAGKTTLLVALWEALLEAGEIGSYRFGGTKTAFAFERRAWASRWNSGLAAPETERTWVSESGWLHLRLGSDGPEPDLLLSDLSGEFFERVRQGAPIADELPELVRVDCLCVLVDGQGLSDPARRGTVVAESRRLLQRLVVGGGLSEDARVVVVLTKSDQLSDEGAKRWNSIAADMLSRASGFSSTLVETAARPVDGSDPVGLPALVSAILGHREVHVRSPSPTRASRTLGRLR